ncbi:hypothetical protein I4U23_030244 [Adineta vaga]|nr:hypothetical protein I4U23_030244 [Adineta vaga]
MKIDRLFRSTIQSLVPVQIFLCYCFCASGLLLNFTQLLLWIIIWPFNKRLYRRINYYLGTLLWSQLTFLYTWWADSDISVYVDPEDVEYLKHEYALNLVNHRYEIDWLVGMTAAQKLGLLGGSKIVGKRSLSLIPILGWSWFFTESIFLRRVWESDKKILENDIQQLVSGYPDNYFFNFLMACEGTRFTEKKRLESMKYAKEKDLPELKHHILPRTKGFTLILQGAKGKIPGIYNFMLAFTKDSASPKFRTLLEGRRCKAQLYVKRIPVSQIPYEDEKQCAQWLHELFQEKDRIYDHFLRHDTFDGLGVPKVPLNRSYTDIAVEIFWLIVIGIPSLKWFIQFLLVSTWSAKIIFALVILIGYIILQAMINMSVIKLDTKKKSISMMGKYSLTKRRHSHQSKLLHTQQETTILFNKIEHTNSTTRLKQHRMNTFFRPLAASTPYTIEQSNTFNDGSPHSLSRHQRLVLTPPVWCSTPKQTRRQTPNNNSHGRSTSSCKQNPSIPIISQQDEMG